MKHFYTVFLFFITLQVLAQDTKYETERIIWNGISYPYRYHHLEQYFNYYPEKRPVASVDSTIINRNYVAVFEVQDNKFYLNNLLVSGNSSKEKNHSVLKELQNKNEPMLLHWVSGLFEFGMGEEQFHPNDTINPYYNDYIVFEVVKGTIGRVENFTYNQLKLFKDYQYRRFRQNNDYQRLFRRLIQNGMSEIEASSHIYHYILFYSKSNFLKK